ncbi:MAG: MFS transporter, partial [Actinobacteria bacterium]|nr:MFS transporter [Actinomycetota bacterium]
MSPRAVVQDLFSSLRVRNYRLFTIAQLISISGTWMQTVAQTWLVLSLTGSGVALGIVTGLQFLPTALGGLWGGIVADRFDKRKILVGTQAAAGILAGVLGVLTMTHVVLLWHVYVLAFLLGVVTALDTPARQAFVIEMVGTHEVANAVGLNSAVFNTGRIVGPAVAAVVIKLLGLAMAFNMNALSYIPPVIALLMMDRRALHSEARAARQKGMVREGLRFAWSARPIRRALLVLTVVATVAFNFSVTVPLMAKFTFGKDVSAYAILTSTLAGGG